MQLAIRDAKGAHRNRVLYTFFPPPRERKVCRMRKMVMLVSAVVAALGLAVAGPASERELSRHPIGGAHAPPMGSACVGCGVSE